MFAVTDKRQLEKLDIELLEVGWEDIFVVGPLAVIFGILDMFWKSVGVEVCLQRQKAK